MRGFLTTILGVFLVWLVWALFSTGGLHKLKNITSEGEASRSIEFLLSKLNYSESNKFWDNFHVEQCSFYMPNWEKAELCVRARIYCEAKVPEKHNKILGNVDIFSEDFRRCYLKNRPYMGLVEWLHGSRELLRLGLITGRIWLTGGYELKGREQINKYENENREWLKIWMKWMKKGV